MDDFKNLIKLICDWDEYITRLESEGLFDGSSQIYDFMSNLYSCAATILIHGDTAQTLEFVKSMANWGEVAEKIKSDLLTEGENTNENSDQ